MLVLNYGATDVAPTEKDQLFHSSKRKPDFQTHNELATNKNLVMGPAGDRNHERVCC
jgi:hypothetical protein